MLDVYNTFSDFEQLKAMELCPMCICTSQLATSLDLVVPNLLAAAC